MPELLARNCHSCNSNSASRMAMNLEPWLSSLRLLRGKYISVWLDHGRSSKWLKWLMVPWAPAIQKTRAICSLCQGHKRFQAAQHRFRVGVGALGTNDSKQGRHVRGHSQPPCRAPASCPALLLRRIMIFPSLPPSGAFIPGATAAPTAAPAASPRLP
jgi:hypothetical protein